MTFAIEDDVRDVMALMIAGAWDVEPLGPVAGVHLDRPFNISKARRKSLKNHTAAVMLADMRIAKARADALHVRA